MLTDAMLRRLPVLLLAFFVCAAAHGAPTLRILFIGNSYTYANDMPQLLQRVAQAGTGAPLQVEAVTSGGVSLKWHWEQGLAQAALHRQQWDYVVLQDFSTLPITDPATVQRYVRLFDEEIRAAGARTVLYLTWARAYAPQTQADLNRTYYGLARELGARVAPVGPAWAIAAELDPRLRLYDSDNSHPTLAGSYLAAYVFHVALFGKAPALARVPQGLTPAEHRTLVLAAVRATGQRERQAAAQKKQGDLRRPEPEQSTTRRHRSALPLPLGSAAGA